MAEFHVVRVVPTVLIALLALADLLVLLALLALVDLPLQELSLLCRTVPSDLFAWKQAFVRLLAKRCLLLQRQELACRAVVIVSSVQAVLPFVLNGRLQSG